MNKVERKSALQFKFEMNKKQKAKVASALNGLMGKK